MGEWDAEGDSDSDSVAEQRRALRQEGTMSEQQPAIDWRPGEARREPMHPDAPNPIIRAVLAIALTVGVLGIAVALIFHDVPTDNADVLGALLGQLVTILAGVTAFYFMQRAKERSE